LALNPRPNRTRVGSGVWMKGVIVVSSDPVLRMIQAFDSSRQDARSRHAFALL
jgi:hypothetical protein